MTTALGTAIVNRWNSAGLDDTDLPATTLYQGGDEPVPEGTGFPRASYEILDDAERSKSRRGRNKEATVRFTVWDDSAADCGTALSNIESDFHNCDKASSNGFSISGATVQSVEFVSASGPTKQDSVVYQGIVDILVRWHKTNSNPSS